MAWSELIFSDAMYPVNDFFLESIEPEVRQNVRRINRHPSNAQWAGGNEIEGIVTYANRSLENGTHYLDEVSLVLSAWEYCWLTYSSFAVCYVIPEFPP
jgi:beta-mannosidase